MVLSCLSGASLSNASLCSKRHFKPAVGPTPGFAANRAKCGALPTPGFDRQSCATSLPGTSVQLILSCLPGASQAVQMVLSYLPAGCLPGASQAVRWILFCFPGASQAVHCVLSCLPGASQAVQMVVSCLPGASLSKGNPVLRAASLCYGHPTVELTQDLPRTGPIAIEIVLKVIQNPAPFQNRDSIAVQLILSCLPGAPTSLVPRWLSDGSFPASLVPRRLSN